MIVGEMFDLAAEMSLLFLIQQVGNVNHGYRDCAVLADCKRSGYAYQNGEVDPK